jgi:G protein-coupled receptor Mth (Methuselah protein)
MNLKLFIVMGILWLIEIIDTLVEFHQTMSYFVDAFNLMQGVLVFLIFVFKKKVLMALQKKLGKFNPFDTCGLKRFF